MTVETGMNPRLLLVIGLGAAVLATTAWLRYPGVPKSLVDPTKRRFMHCPECGRERMYHPDFFDQPCPYCEKRLVATEESIKSKNGGPTSRFGLMASLLGAEVVGLMAAILFVVKMRPRTPEDEEYYFNCARCGQKIRFRLAQVGLAAICPRCKRAIVFPEVDDE
jgi:DNA-directed RNA polymerase subunit RPC12/RpoP